MGEASERSRSWAPKHSDHSLSRTSAQVLRVKGIRLSFLFIGRFSGFMAKEKASQNLVWLASQAAVAAIMADALAFYG